ncbi:MAG: hypothetical protein NCW75_05060 [Phycisphaera sp.]|nr:MAG: hypothetical protein NCW75_05060 [Phycisphaera sp.]
MAAKKATVPSGDRASLAFTEARAQVWSDNAALLGIGDARAAELIASSDAAAVALRARIAAAEAAEAATIAWHAAAARNRALAQELVRTIRYTATSGADPDAVYAAARIDPPSGRRELPEPGVPEDLDLTLDSQGRAVLRFEGCRHGGTVWAIQRRTTSVDGHQSDWENVATVIRREFVDGTTPAGVGSVGYRVRAQRHSGVSAYSAPATLPMGVRSVRNETAGAIAPAESVGKRAG